MTNEIEDNGTVDPIVKIIADILVAIAAYEQEEEGNSSAAEIFDRIGKLEAQVLSTVPTTPSGSMALLRYLADSLDQDGPDKFGDSIRSAVDFLEERGALS
ncbi:hypothetical protein [Methylocystis sp. SB2]|uniref:hypothetical protein n=1 Tax=Methylocystis sp. (strain SB2) TaxID=743836 RepID=UPI00040A6A8C|nr:hypothetical protein [Methylocystis sp. SB2]ULO25121.1 hypothetical protein LNB28_06955 [Methylocystis sp. SB2]